MSAQHAQRFLILLIPALAALVVHLPSLSGAFVYDDLRLVAQHPSLGEPAFAGRAFLRDYGLEFAGRKVGYYRPLFMLADHAIYRLCGPRPAVYHAFSLLFFVGVTILLTRIIAALCGGDHPGIVVAAGCAYAVHPARTELVSLFMSFPDLFVEGTALLLLWTTIRLDPTVRPLPVPRTRWPKTAAVCGLAAMAAGLVKESAFFVLPAIAVTCLAHAMWRRDVPTLRVAGWAALAGLAASFAVRVLVGIQGQHAILAYPGAVLTVGAGRSLEAVLVACRDLLVPGPAVFWKALHMSSGPWASLALGVLLLLMALTWFRLVRDGRLSHALLFAWFGAGIVNLLFVASSRIPYSERFLPVAPAVIGLSLLAARLDGCWEGRSAAQGRRLAVIAAALWVVVGGGFTWNSVNQCRTPTAFFSDVVEANRDEPVPWVALAETLQTAGSAEAMERCARQATALDAHHPQVQRLHNALVKRYLRDGRYADALRCVDWSLSLYPNDADKIALKAVALAFLGERDQALRQIESALRLAPQNDAYLQLQKEIQANRSPPTAQPSPNDTD